MTLLEAQPPELEPPVAVPVNPINPDAPVSCGVVWPPLDFLAAGPTASSPVSAAVPTPVPVSQDETSATAFTWDVVDEWGMDSFPASDPPANW